MRTGMNPPQLALRKAAILVASLEPKAADALLDQMPAQRAAAIRAAALQLDDVSEQEERRVVEDFLRAKGGHDPDDGVELAPSLARRLAAEKSPLPSPTSSPASNDSFRLAGGVRFTALTRATPAAVAAVLLKERPQTAALVLSHLAPERAADILALFPEAFQTEVLARVARLAEPDPEFVNEIEKHLEQELKSSFVVDTNPHGLPVAAAILQNASPIVRRSMMERLAARDQDLAHSLSPVADLPLDGRSTPEAIRVEATPPAAGAPAEEADDDAISFGDLHSLDNRSWLRILGACDPKVAVLALAGADVALVERILGSLSRRDRRRLRQEMNGIGPLRLRDVDHAQHRLAQTASRLADAGVFSLPRRQFSAAA